MGLIDRLKRSWNAFIGLDPPNEEHYSYGQEYSLLSNSSSYRPDRTTLKPATKKTIVGSIFNKIAVDCSQIDIKHVKIDNKERYSSDVASGLNECLTLQANIDQTHRDLIQDIIISMFDEGVVAVVPIDTDTDPQKTDSYDILSLRTGKITQWFPNDVMVECYDDRTGIFKQIKISKEKVAIINNPFYSIMNEPNSILQRLIHKLSLLDVIDDRVGGGKLDLLIQLPYIIKTKARQDQAEKRRQDIESQLANSKYGIAYTDGTEHVTQLNRPIENKIFEQVVYYMNMLFNQMGIHEDILNNKASDVQMLNYKHNVIKPVMNAIVDEFNRKFLTKTARTQGHRIMYFNNLFSLITVDKLAEIADKFTRNEIMSSNEVRQIVGLKPSTDPSADELRNKNLPVEDEKVNGDDPKQTNNKITKDTKVSELED